MSRQTWWARTRRAPTRPAVDEADAVARLPRDTPRPPEPELDTSRMPIPAQRRQHINQIMANYRALAAEWQRGSPQQ